MAIGCRIDRQLLFMTSLNVCNMCYKVLSNFASVFPVYAKISTWPGNLRCEAFKP